MAKSKGYLNQGWDFIINLIVAIFPDTNRIKENYAV